MSADFYELLGVEQLDDGGTLQFERSRALRESIVRHRDYSLVGLFARQAGGLVTDEILVVDVECHGVPSRNLYGIRFH